MSGDPFVTHRNAPLTPEGRRRAVEEVLGRGRPVSHVAAEFRIARGACWLVALFMRLDCSQVG